MIFLELRCNASRGGYKGAFVAKNGALQFHSSAFSVSSFVFDVHSSTQGGITII